MAAGSVAATHLLCPLPLIQPPCRTNLVVARIPPGRGEAASEESGETVATVSEETGIEATVIEVTIGALEIALAAAAPRVAIAIGATALLPAVGTTDTIAEDLLATTLPHGTTIGTARLLRIIVGTMDPLLLTTVVDLLPREGGAAAMRVLPVCLFSSVTLTRTSHHRIFTRPLAASVRFGTSTFLETTTHSSQRALPLSSLPVSVLPPKPATKWIASS